MSSRPSHGELDDLEKKALSFGVHFSVRSNRVTSASVPTSSVPLFRFRISEARCVRSERVPDRERRLVKWSSSRTTLRAVSKPMTPYGARSNSTSFS
mgnify:CR=1 FL=1